MGLMRSYRVTAPTAPSSTSDFCPQAYSRLAFAPNIVHI